MNKEILQKAIEQYGEEAQQDMFIEESSELTKALLKYRRVMAEAEKHIHIDYSTEVMLSLKEIESEIADVYITLKQLVMMFDCGKEVEQQIEFKMKRLNKRLEG